MLIGVSKMSVKKNIFVLFYFNYYVKQRKQIDIK